MLFDRAFERCDSPYSSAGIVRVRVRVNIKAVSEGVGLSPGGKILSENSPWRVLKATSMHSAPAKVLSRPQELRVLLALCCEFSKRVITWIVGPRFLRTTDQKINNRSNLVRFFPIFFFDNKFPVPVNSIFQRDKRSALLLLLLLLRGSG